MPSTDLKNQDFLKFNELRRYLSGIGEVKLRRMIREGQFPKQILPGLWSRPNIDDWLREDRNPKPMGEMAKKYDEYTGRKEP